LGRGFEIDGITRVVDGETHLSSIRISLAPGSFNVLLGRTGAGKTSLLRVLAGLDRPTAGAIREDGVDVTGVDVRRRNVAMVYQQFVNYPSLTVYENIASPLRVGGKLEAAALDRRVRETAAALRVDHLLDRLPGELSGGQQQRTAMARALAKDAGLLLLDEPLANLDYKLREELRTEIRKLFRGRSAVVVYATTEPAEALLLGGHTAVLHEGRLLQTGPTLEVYGRPANERVGQVFSDPQMNLFDVEVTEASGSAVARLSASVELPLGGHLAELPKGRLRLGVRPSHVGLERAATEDVLVPARVEIEEVSGSETLVHAVHEGVALSALASGVRRHGLGASISLFIPPSRLFAFAPSGELLAAPKPREEATSHGAD
jgi:glycerol transport system ATP-binding protein